MTAPVPLLVVGAGPCGLAVGVAARMAGIECVLLDRGTIVHTLERFPLNMTFFSTPERIEIGDVPFTTVNDKPTRRDGLVYYRRVAEHFGLDVRTGAEVLDLRRLGGGRPGDGPAPDAPGVEAPRFDVPRFEALVRRRSGEELHFRAHAVVLATGYFDWPNCLGVPGEELPHVTHYFTEGHHYWRQRVVVVGAGNSAVDAALECWRAGAQVTLVHFDEEFDRSVKAWVLPDIVNRVKEGSVTVRWRSRVTAIAPDAVEVLDEATGRRETLAADAVLAMTGYHADTTMLRRLGVPVDPVTGIAAHDEATMMTPVPGCYLAGVIASGNDANRLFIENTRHHGELIVRHLLEAGRP
jgi:thioredoxin reductase (NADPH)